MRAWRALASLGLLAVFAVILPGCQGPGGSGSDKLETSLSASLHDRVSIQPRRNWTAAKVDLANVTALSKVSRITVHHTGVPAPAGSTFLETARAIEALRAEHVRRRFADIRYHYIIDPAGRIWEGRPVSFQGALIEDDNAATVGVALLGDFSGGAAPTPAALRSLRALLAALAAEHQVEPAQVLAASELRATRSPGDVALASVRAWRTEHAALGPFTR